MYNFKDQYEKQDFCLQWIFLWIKREYDVDIIIATLEEDKEQGIDAWIVSKKRNREDSWQFKCDFKAAETRNTFVETHSNVLVNPPTQGCVEKCQATYLFTYVPDDNYAIVSVVVLVQQLLPEWEERYKKGFADNKNPLTGEKWRSRGVLVPRGTFWKNTGNIIQVPPDPRIICMKERGNDKRNRN